MKTNYRRLSKKGKKESSDFTHDSWERRRDVRKKAMRHKRKSTDGGYREWIGADVTKLRSADWPADDEE